MSFDTEEIQNAAGRMATAAKKRPIASAIIGGGAVGTLIAGIAGLLLKHQIETVVGSIEAVPGLVVAVSNLNAQVAANTVKIDDVNMKRWQTNVIFRAA